ncbi:MAG: U32 family peptidase, partial [Bacilli bacterium]|nr:U32 family peptidase [Bacilli bacterium]
GADAVYLGCKSFGARRFASNFDSSEIIKAIRMCHLYGVRIYVTMNTLIKNSEVDSFLEQARFLHENGVDALIVQDFGMICLLREKFPNLEIHASTQANISSVDVCKLYYDLGVKRVVFSRELSIEEVDSIRVPIEKEAFIHGALCISYSGCCLMSSMLGGRSGNRGECAGVCRMPYTLYEDHKKIKSGYLLSTKELNTSSKIKRLLDSSIDSFKIEGRMKGPLYVGFITRFYRKLIDGEEIDYSWYMDSLKTIFHREFTVGRLFGATDLEFMNTKSPNHIGLEIGKVISVNPKKIKIQLYPNQVLNQNDAIRFSKSEKGFVVNYLYDEEDLLTSRATGICYLDNKIGLENDDILLKTFDSSLNEMILNVNEKKIPVSFSVVARRNMPLRIEISDSSFSESIDGNIVESSKNAPITKEGIMKQLKKLGNTPFTLKDVSIEMDSNIFISVGEINSIRRELCSKLQSLRENRNYTFLEKEVSFDFEQTTSLSGISCFVRNQEQLDTCLELGVHSIFVDNRDLYLKYENNPSIYYVVPRNVLSVSEYLEKRNFVSDYANYSNSSVIPNYTLNVTNIYTAYYLQKLGFSSIILSVELTEEEINEFISLYHEKFGDCTFFIFSYGKVENMIIKGNVLELKKDKN